MSTNDESTERQVTELLELFYPVHYKSGVAFEDALRAGRLTRKQTAILWLIYSEGKERQQMRRKDIERRLQTWFEVSSSAITKAVRGMSRPPLSLLRVVEDPQSAREKQVVLTSKGERFLEGMITNGRNLLRRLVVHIGADEVDAGIRYLRQITAAFDADTNGRYPSAK